MNKIAVIGAGYVGMATALTLASKHEVTVVESNPERLNSIKSGNFYIKESDFQELFCMYHTEIKFVPILDNYDYDYIYICVGTPSSTTGRLNTEAVNDIIIELAKNKYSGIIFIKSTLNLGDTSRFSKMYPINIVHYPEFLREGSAINDTLNPDRIILGLNPYTHCMSSDEFNGIINFIRSTVKNEPRIIITESNSSELIKLASNSYLALRLSYFNSIKLLCDRINADPKVVIDGICADNRIGKVYATPSIGFAGPCLPKDSMALYKSDPDLMRILGAAIEINERNYMVYRTTIENFMKQNNVTIIFLGVAFKSYSSDIRDSLSYKLYNDIKSRFKDRVKLYDPRSGFNLEDLHADVAVLSSHEYLYEYNEYHYEYVFDIKGIL